MADRNNLFNSGIKMNSPDSLMSGDFITKSLLSSNFSDDSLENVKIPIKSEEINCADQEENDPVGYLDREVFPVLLPCLETMLFAAKENNVLKVQKSRFNGLDFLAELLWNRNPLHPERREAHIPIFDIPFVKDHLAENPRPVYPRSWLWTPEQAAVVIQAAVRGYWVRRSEQVQEMRIFWKELKEEKLLMED